MFVDETLCLFHSHARRLPQTVPYCGRPGFDRLLFSRQGGLSLLAILE